MTTRTLLALALLLGLLVPPRPWLRAAIQPMRAGRSL